jgi:hypothetical protein
MDKEKMVLYIHVRYYWATKKYEIMSFAGKWIEIEIITLSEINQAQKAKYVFIHMQNLDLK